MSTASTRRSPGRIPCRSASSGSTLSLPVSKIADIPRPSSRANRDDLVDTAPTGTIKKDLERAPLLGTIRVLVWQGIKTGTCAGTGSVRQTNDLTVVAKALKGRAVSHGTR